MSWSQKSQKNATAAPDDVRHCPKRCTSFQLLLECLQLQTVITQDSWHTRLFDIDGPEKAKLRCPIGVCVCGNWTYLVHAVADRSHGRSRRLSTLLNMPYLIAM